MTLALVQPTPTQAEFIATIRSDIDASKVYSRERLQHAAEQLALWQECSGFTQAQMGDKLGYSQTTVSLLLKWRSKNYEGTPWATGLHITKTNTPQDKLD